MTYETGLKFGGKDQDRTDILRCVLMNAGAPGDKIVERYEKGRTVISLYDKSRARSLSLSRKLKALKLKNVKVFLSGIKDLNWKTNWKKYFRPFNINRDIRIIPGWMKKTAAVKGYNPVYLDTTFAFGSGMHATTQMMAGLIHSRKRSLESFFDIGTGSGILALIAWVYGCRDVWALDIDPVSIKTAAANCALNGCRPEYLKALKFEDFKSTKKFDFVAANLLTEDLIRLRGKLVAAVKPGGYLAVSGIFSDNYPSLKKRFRVPGIVCVADIKKKKWHALLFKRA